MKVPQATFLLVTATAASAALHGGHGGTDESSSAKAGKREWRAARWPPRVCRGNDARRLLGRPGLGGVGRLRAVPSSGSGLGSELGRPGRGVSLGLRRR